MAINRSELNRALAKACAFKECGKEKEARTWARQLIRLLELEEILITPQDKKMIRMGEALDACL